MLKKIFGIVSSLLLIATCIIVYLFFFKDYDIEDENVDQIVDGDFHIELPEESGLKEKHIVVLENEEETSKESKTDSEAKDSQDYKDNNTSNSNHERNHYTDASPNKDDKPAEHTVSETNTTPSKEKILQKYEPTFEKLQIQAEAKLVELATYAYEEYKEKKKNGEKVSYSYFFQKYKAAADQLENRIDEQFYIIYDHLVTELKQNGYKKQVAEPILNHYKSTKKQREDRMISEALDRF